MTGRHSLDQIVRGLDGVTPGDAFPAQNYNCPCIHPSQCDNSCFPIVGFERLSIRAGGSDDTAYAFTEADDEGDYVTYNDAKRAISAAEARATAAEATVTALQEALSILDDNREQAGAGAFVIQLTVDEMTTVRRARTALSQIRSEK